MASSDARAASTSFTTIESNTARNHRWLLSFELCVARLRLERYFMHVVLAICVIPTGDRVSAAFREGRPTGWGRRHRRSVVDREVPFGRNFGSNPVVSSR